MELTVGDKVVYVGRGPCLIGGIVDKEICGSSAKFYRLALLDDSNAEFYVPVGKSSDLPIRPLLSRSELPKLLENLKPRGAVARAASGKDRRQQIIENLRLCNSGSIFEVARIVESLTRLSGAKALNWQEREALGRARQLLISEIAAVMDESKGAAEARIERALESAD